MGSKKKIFDRDLADIRNGTEGIRILQESEEKLTGIEY